MNAIQQKTNFHRKEALLVFISLFLIFLYHFSMIIFPCFSTVYSSLTKWNGIGTKHFIGFGNYIRLFKDPAFYFALLNNVKWMLLFISIPILFSLVIGYVISKKDKGILVLRTCYFLPYIISAAVAGKIFATFFNPIFGMNLFFDNIGLEFLKRQWLSPDNSLVTVAFVDMWHWWGFLLVIFLSALQQIDKSLYECADIEGCNEFQKWFYITIPSIKSTIIFILLVTIVWSFSTFDYIWVMTKGGPGSEILSTLLYKNALFTYKAGYSCSMSVFQGLLAALVFIIFGIFRKKMED